MSLSAKDIQTGAAAELLLLINEVTDDGKISREEVVEAEIYTPESTRGNLCLVSNFIGATKGGKFGPTGVPERSKKDATPPSAVGGQKGLAILIGLAAFFVMLARC
jgi:hypothetical protein